MGKREITAGKNDAGLRLDKFLLKKYNDLPVSLMYKLIRKKDITVNRHRTEEKYIMHGSTFFNGAWRDYVVVDKMEEPMPQQQRRKSF